MSALDAATAKRAEAEGVVQHAYVGIRAYSWEKSLRDNPCDFMQG